MYIQLINSHKTNTMQSITKSLLLIVLTVIISATGVAQDKAVAGKLFPRKYKVGDSYRYRLTTEQVYNGKWNSTSVVELELKVILDSAGRPADEVYSISKKVFSPKDTVNADAEALAVKPYVISLDPDGKLEIPPIDVPGMTGPITDLITFFVAISPQSRVTTLEKEGDSLVRGETARGNFANGKTILVGDDCLAIKAYLSKVTQKEIALRTAFLPPSTPCITFLLDDMSKPVTKGVRNNFQMVQPAGPNKFNVQYGNEEFTINSRVSRRDGKLLEATMSNTLQLSLRMQCNTNYKECQMEVPFQIQRNLHLELIQ